MGGSGREAHEGSGGNRRGDARFVLLAILGVAALLRFLSVHFGLPALNDPDELTFELGALKMLRGATLNPGWFGHPATTTMYVLAVLTVAVFGVGHLLGWFPSIEAFAEAIYNDPTWVMLPGRAAMVLFGVGTVYLTYRLADALFGRRTALIAAALLAVNPVHVTWSQIIRSDMMACFFMLLALLAALRIARGDRWRDYVLAALWLGAAVATKWPYAITVLAVFGAVALRLASHWDERNRLALRLCLFGAMALGFLLLISPYLLLDHQAALRDMHGEAQVHHLGATGGNPLENAWWYLSVPVLAGLGPSGMALAAGGVAILARDRAARGVVMPVLLGFFALLCFQHTVWERWALALMPILAIAGAAGLSALAGYLTARPPARVARAATALVLALTLGSPALTVLGDTRARLNDTRQLASTWLAVHAAPGSMVLIEHFAFDLVRSPFNAMFPIGDAGCVDGRSLLHSRVQLQSIQAVRGARTNLDYGTLGPAKRAACRPDYAILTQYDRYAAERAAFPAEYAAYRELLQRGAIVATIRPIAGQVGGPIVRIVRFSLTPTGSSHQATSGSVVPVVQRGH